MADADPTQQQRRSYGTGILLLLIVVFLWTASNFVTQASQGTTIYQLRPPNSTRRGSLTMAMRNPICNELCDKPAVYVFLTKSLESPTSTPRRSLPISFPFSYDISFAVVVAL